MVVWQEKLVTASLTFSWKPWTQTAVSFDFSPKRTIQRCPASLEREWNNLIDILSKSGGILSGNNYLTFMWAWTTFRITTSKEKNLDLSTKCNKKCNKVHNRHAKLLSQHWNKKDKVIPPQEVYDDLSLLQPAFCSHYSLLSRVKTWEEG